MPGLHYILIHNVAKEFFSILTIALAMRFMRAQSRALPKLLERATVHIKARGSRLPFVNKQLNHTMLCVSYMYIYYTRVTNTVLGLVQ